MVSVLIHLHWDSPSTGLAKGSSVAYGWTDLVSYTCRGGLVSQGQVPERMRSWFKKQVGEPIHDEITEGQLGDRVLLVRHTIEAIVMFFELEVSFTIYCISIMNGYVFIYVYGCYHHVIAIYLYGFFKKKLKTWFVFLHLPLRVCTC